MKKRFDLSAAALHILAMAFMLMDHLWATLLPAQEWLTGVGRLAFPMFAFMAVEGYFHTRSFKRYALRMLAFALLSEIPFDLMYGGTWFYPVHQNVIWTLLIGLLGIHLMEKVRQKGKTWCYVLTCVGVTVLGAILGTVGMVDYYGAGVLTVFVFYFFRGRAWWKLLGQIVALYWINVQMLGGQLYPVSLFGVEFELCQQGACAVGARTDLALSRAAGLPQQTVPVCLLCLLSGTYAGAGAAGKINARVTHILIPAIIIKQRSIL